MCSGVCVVSVGGEDERRIDANVDPPAKMQSEASAEAVSRALHSCAEPPGAKRDRAITSHRARPSSYMNRLPEISR